MSEQPGDDPRTATSTGGAGPAEEPDVTAPGAGEGRAELWTPGPPLTAAAPALPLGRPGPATVLGPGGPAAAGATSVPLRLPSGADAVPGGQDPRAVTPGAGPAPADGKTSASAAGGAAALPPSGPSAPQHQGAAAGPTATAPRPGLPSATVLPAGRGFRAPGAPTTGRAPEAAPVSVVRQQPRPLPTGLQVRSRRTKVILRRVDPWSVFVFSFIAAVFVGVALIVAVAVLSLVLGHLGVIASVNKLVADVTQDSGPGAPRPAPLLTAGRILGITSLLSLLDVVLFTALATLSAFLYNLCASLSGGIEVSLHES